MNLVRVQLTMFWSMFTIALPMNTSVDKDFFVLRYDKGHSLETSDIIHSFSSSLPFVF